jgi:membrane protease YdiL (CAAX protease family)
VAEELLFRGLLLTALRERLGSIDAVAVTGALFAIIHLDPQQFFVYCVLGFACGTAVLASGSAGPAMALHFAFNAAAVAAGMLLQ